MNERSFWVSYNLAASFHFEVRVPHLQLTRR